MNTKIIGINIPPVGIPAVGAKIIQSFLVQLDDLVKYHSNAVDKLQVSRKHQNQLEKLVDIHVHVLSTYTTLAWIVRAIEDEKLTESQKLFDRVLRNVQVLDDKMFQLFNDFVNLAHPSMQPFMNQYWSEHENVFLKNWAESRLHKSLASAVETKIKKRLLSLES
jgi:hypothetical protein